MSEEDNIRKDSLAEILSRKRGGLKPTLTKVTNTNGIVEIYDHGAPVPSDVRQSGYGFVVDTKPDLSIGVVLPWLLVSSQDVPADINLLKQSGITHVLSLLPGFQLSTPDESIKHLCLDFYDEDTFHLDYETLKPAFQFIGDAKTSGGRVLIHCNAGISRAPSVAIFYLMAIQRMPFHQAWETVQRARPMSKPNSGFLTQLKKFKLEN